MTERGEATRERLIEATRQVVRDTGYSQATTRTIARAAGVTEGTIYRHFPNKTALFFAAAMDRHTQIVAELSGLPGRAGQGTITGNLTEALTSLAALREDIMPLELAILTDPDLAAGHLTRRDGRRQHRPHRPGPQRCRAPTARAAAATAASRNRLTSSVVRVRSGARKVSR